MIWYGRVGTAEAGPFPDEQAWPTLPEGWVVMNTPRPENRPSSLGDWFVEASGDWTWVRYPEPIAFYQNKLINLGNMLEISPDSLPGDVAGRLSGVEQALNGIAEAMALEVHAAQQARQGAESASQQAQQHAQDAGAAVQNAIGSLPKPMQFEVISVTLGAGGTGSASFSKTFTAAPIIIPIARWGGASGDQMFVAVPGTPTLTGVVVSGRRSRGTLLLTSGPFEPAVAGDVVQFAVIGR